MLRIWSSWCASNESDAPRGKRFADKAIDDAMLDLYNPAQLDVLRRAGEIVRGLAT
ncbi:hypothetical protein M2272_002183 [Mycobacterium frederiksbergense]|uniref:Uncharacterized protein n=1 Tax=Mycolicibacterium frederiksbergense TaxID=117567 RepID=A0ABT6KY30_9MYCO|nr:hypothetical protein [Mycolicibacterium frederiksbergense]MDH6195543.1 hypothetical protein [Mycolicibacterium frederiksbergense]